MLSKFRRDEKGFTPIELMIVMVIIGILAALAIPHFMVAEVRAKQSEAKQILKQIYLGEQAYHQKHGTYWAGGKTGSWLDGDQDTVRADRKALNNFFSGIKVGLSPSAIYEYEITADEDGFRAVASANIDDDDAQDVWSIDESGKLTHDLDDVDNRQH